MEFFDKLGKKATEAYKVTADKTGKIAKETKLKFKMGELKNQINDIYEEIGKKVYEQHVREKNMSIEKDLEEKCTQIDVLSDEIDSLLKECLDLKNKKQCQKCHTQIEKEAKFCPECGKKQTEEPSREVEILNRLENANINTEKQEEKEIVKENVEQEKKESENQEKNIDIKEVFLENEKIETTSQNEANDKEQDKQEEQIQQRNQILQEEEAQKKEEEPSTRLEKTVEVESNVYMPVVDEDEE